ncbi:MAG: ABC transporter substrate-binding protein [Chloroflexi bacterium]|nr:ABC transporter substrate-binding protein [Chloroflexota bacterium]
MPAGLAKITPLNPKVTLHVAATAGNSAYLPLFYAKDKGYFDQAGLNVDLQLFRGSITTLIPRLATGDLDIAPGAPSPATFNMAPQGFDAKIVAGYDVSRPERPTGGWLMVITREKDNIKDYKDLKGHPVEGAVMGSPADLFAREAVKKGGLDPNKDVTMKYDVKGDPSDLLNIAKAQAADVVSTFAPLWVPLEQQGYAVRWKASEDAAPWYQAGLLIASGKSLQQNRPAIAKFLEVFLATAREINKTDGQWTDDLANTIVKNGQDCCTVAQVKGSGDVVSYRPDGAINVDSLNRSEDLWVEEGQVKQKVDPAKLIDNGPLGDAIKEIGAS